MLRLDIQINVTDGWIILIHDKHILKSAYYLMYYTSNFYNSMI